MNTKERILKTAVRLFNKSGINSISIRTIAAELNMSHGNLEYHFKNKQELLLAIYHVMIAEMSAVYPLDEPQKLTFNHFNYLLKHLENFHIKYRFFHLDLIEISRNFSEITSLLHENMQLRKNQMQLYFNKFLEEGLLSQAKDKFYYDHLQHTIRLMITFWLLQKEVLSGYNYKNKGEMTKHIWELIIPNMTEKGLQKYKELI